MWWWATSIRWRAGPPRTDVRTIALPALKDDPDMLSALKVGWSAGCREFHVYGGLGGRIDHTISGIQLIGIIGPAGARRVSVW